MGMPGGVPLSWPRAYRFCVVIATVLRDGQAGIEAEGGRDARITLRLRS